CSVLGGRRSVVFDLARGASARVDVAQSLFARCPDPPDAKAAGSVPEGGACVLIRQGDSESERALVYKGKDNCYHDLDGFWALGDSWQEAGWTNFRKRLADSSGEDDSRVLTCYPWQEAPGQLLLHLGREELGQAFAVKLQMRALRQARSPG